jgi:hypothetical protein
MAKDMTDDSTHDFIQTPPNIVHGQVLMDRHRHFAIVAKTGRTVFHLVCVNSGMLKVKKYSAKQITDEWIDAEYPFEKALDRLQTMGRKHGVTDAAKILLDGLSKSGKEPTQDRLFG